MSFARLPDWSVYAASLAAVLLASGARLEHADAPPPPNLGVGGSAADPDAQAPAGPSVRIAASLGQGPRIGSAFSVNEAGVWLTARHVVDACRSVVVLTGPGHGVAARVVIDSAAEAAVLLTNGGPPGLPLAAAMAKRGSEAFHPGFPRGRPGEAASRLLGGETFIERGRDRRAYGVLTWAEAGHTLGLSGALPGLSGAPALNEAGEVVGITIAQTPRRGRLFTTTTAQMRHALALAGAAPSAGLAGQPIDTGNYGRVADDLRRELRVAQVVCT
ncbi:MAG: serine protease [Caulobacteraceae bacterium]|nr:serine protease [Caulobacteraceae bacterium]